MAYKNGTNLEPQLGDVVLGEVRAGALVSGDIIALDTDGRVRVAFVQVIPLPALDMQANDNSKAWRDLYSDVGMMSKLVETPEGMVALVGRYAVASASDLELVARADGTRPT